MSILKVAKNTGYVLDIDVRIPASKEDEFLNRYNSYGWNSEKKGKSLIFYPPTMGVEEATKFCKSLPDYAEVKEASVFSDNGHKRIFKGPLNLSDKQVFSFVNEWIESLERRLSELEKTEHAYSLHKFL